MEDPTLSTTSRARPPRNAPRSGNSPTIWEFFSTLIAPLILRWNGVQWRFENSDNVGDSSTPSSADGVPVGTAVYARGRSDIPVAALIRRDPRRSSRHLSARLIPRARPTPSQGRPVHRRSDASRSAPTRWVGLARWSNRGRRGLEDRSVPSLPGASSSVLRIACDAPDRCLAGAATGRTADGAGLFGTVDGASWTVVPMPGDDLISVVPPSAGVLTGDRRGRPLRTRAIGAQRSGSGARGVWEKSNDSTGCSPAGRYGFPRFQLSSMKRSTDENSPRCIHGAGPRVRRDHEQAPDPEPIWSTSRGARGQTLRTRPM
jgi:hypothetical protein